MQGLFDISTKLFTSYDIFLILKLMKTIKKIIKLFFISLITRSFLFFCLLVSPFLFLFFSLLFQPFYHLITLFIQLHLFD